MPRRILLVSVARKEARVEEFPILEMRTNMMSVVTSFASWLAVSASKKIDDIIFTILKYLHSRSRSMLYSGQLNLSIGTPHVPNRCMADLVHTRSLSSERPRPVRSAKKAPSPPKHAGRLLACGLTRSGQSKPVNTHRASSYTIIAKRLIPNWPVSTFTCRTASFLTSLLRDVQQTSSLQGTLASVPA